VPTDDELEELLSHVLDADAPPSPPAERIAALRAQVDADRAIRTAPPDQPVIRAGWPRPRWLAVAASVLLALAVGFAVGQRIDGDADTDVAGAIEFDGAMSGPTGDTADADLTVVATGIGRVIDLGTDVLPILPRGAFYQVWFVGPDDSAATPNRISAGTFHPDADGRTDARFAAAVDPDLFPIIEVTAEPGEGNPLPNGPVVLRAEIAATP
jgi:Anti-sigma-K factor rskA